MESSQTSSSSKESFSLLSWLDILAKSVVILAALLYVVGRAYAEGYYGTLNLPVANLPISAQEYIFMSTRSLNFLKQVLSASLYSVVVGWVLAALRVWLEKGIERIWEKISRQPESGDQNAQAEHNSGDALEKQVEDKIQESFGSRITGWLKERSSYAIVVFISLTFVMLIPGAKMSGRTDAERAIRDAPYGRLVLKTPAIPEFDFRVVRAKQESPLYEYGSFKIVGMLGEWYLVVFSENPLRVLTIPKEEVASVLYAEEVFVP